MSGLYDTNFVLWSEEQAQVIRSAARERSNLPSPADRSAYGWRSTVVRTRQAVGRRLANSPSLKRQVPAMIAEELEPARKVVRIALEEYSEAPRRPLEEITFDESQVLGDWFPEQD